MSAVLITGCSSGIGLETALAFARRGDATYASMRDPHKGRRLLERAEAQGSSVEVLELDVTDEASVESAVRTIERRHGAIDVLVNNAGIADSGPVETIAIERARAVMDTNLWGPVRTTRAVLPAMRARGAGVIVNVSSAAARVPAMPYNGFYAASKHALGALSQSLAWELAPFGIRVVCIEPGFFATEISAKSWGAVDPGSPYGADHRWMNDFFVKNGQASGGDPALVAEAVVRAAHDPAAPLHNLVGDDAVAYVDLAAHAGSHEGWVTVATEIVESLAGPRPRLRPPVAGSAEAA
jgi:NAD(P)-dependent dehydrogenase (short-subunit alcohol dehydrogenase family)